MMLPSTNLTGSAPPTLMQICLNFIGINLSLVDSLVDLPEVIGKQIFDSAARQRMFDTQHTDITTVYHFIRLFSDAYSDVLLTKINLKDCHLAVNNYLDHLFLFTGLEEVDLSNCGLGDGHEFIHHLGKLERLKILNLHQNGLTDEGIRKLTTPIRMFKKGPLQLQNLDISGNTTLSIKIVKYLTCFKNLSLLNLTNTSFQVSDKHILKEKLNLAYKETTSISNFVIKTSGWASDVVTKWMSERISKTKSHLSTKNDGNLTQKFYSRKRKREEIAIPEICDSAIKPLLFFQKLEISTCKEKKIQPPKGKSFKSQKAHKTTESVTLEVDENDLLLSLYAGGKNTKSRNFADMCE